MVFRGSEIMCEGVQQESLKAVRAGWELSRVDMNYDAENRTRAVVQDGSVRALPQFVRKPSYT